MKRIDVLERGGVLRARSPNHRGALRSAVAFALALFGVGLEARAESTAERAAFVPSAPSVAVNLGLLQPLVLGGANVEVDVRLGPFIAAYSHGWSLELPVVGAMADQGVRLHVPYSTGLGLGVQHYVDSLNSFFDLRFEAKVHRFEASYESAEGALRTRIADYTTYTLGGGAYWTWLPFANRSDALRGINLSTSARFWPNVGDTLSASSVAYASTRTGQVERHDAANIGAANTPFFVNASLGYVFQ